MTRQKKGSSTTPGPTSPTLPQVNRLDQLMADLGDTERQIAAREGHLDREIAFLQKEAAAELKPLQAKRDRLLIRIKRDARKHRRTLLRRTGGHTVTLPSGKISWKMGKESVKVTSVGNLEASLRQEFGDTRGVISWTPKVDKSALKKLGPDVLRSLKGVIYRSGRQRRIYIEPNEAKVDTPATGKRG